MYSFENGVEGWQDWNWEKYDNFINDIKVENEEAVICIPKVGQDGDSAQPWGVQFKQTGLPLVKDVEYELSFDMRSSIERELEAVIQNSGYYRVFEDKIIVNSEMKNFKYSFKANATEVVELNFLLGKYGEYEAHEIIIDNIILKVKNPIEGDSDDDNVTGDEEKPEGGDQDSDVENNPEDDNSEENDKIVVEPNTDTGNSNDEEKLPQTGLERGYLLLGISLVMLIIGVSLINK